MFFKKNQSKIYNYLLSLFAVLFLGSILILIQGSNPIVAFSEIVKGSVFGVDAIMRSIRWSIPVIIASQAALIAHRAGINNLGIDGQIYLGAFATAVVGAFVSLPHIPHVIFAIVIGGIAGLVFAILPAVLKAIFHVDEMISSLMLNYVAILLTEFLTMKLMGFTSAKNPDQIATPEILGSASLTVLLPTHQATTGIFIAIGLVIAIAVFYKKFRKGYEWKLLGDNIKFAKYGGIKTVKNYIIVFLLSGFIAGICGAVEILGPHQRFRANFSRNLGWDGIMVALIARNKPLPTLIVSIIWGFIKAGSLSMERMTSVNRVVVTLIQAIFVLFITVDINGKIKASLRNRKQRKEVAKA